MKKVLLINPPRFKDIPVVREVRCAGLTPISVYPPIRLAYIAATLEENDIKADILDANAYDLDFKEVKERVKDFAPGVVIFTCSPTTMTHDLTTAKICKEIDKRIATVLDDTHIAPAMPEAVLRQFKEVDVLIRGESEATALDLVKNIDALDMVKGISYRNGNQVISNPERAPGDLDSIPFPAYHLLPIKKYSSITFSRKKPFVTIVTSVSCPFQCSFCLIGGATVWRGYGKKWRAKSADKVLAEIKYLKNKFGIKSFYFFDETFTVDKKRVLDICHRIKEEKLNIEWSCNSRVDTVDEETLTAMKSAGCWNICYGLESGSERLLGNIKKETDLAGAKKVFDISRKLNLNPSASFMIGLPGEDTQTIKDTLEFTKRLDPVRAQFVLTVPYPGTRLHEEVKNKGLLKKDYSFSGLDAYGIDGEPQLVTETMSADQLVKAQKKIYFGFYLRPSFMLKTLFRIRSLEDLSNLINFLRYL